MKDHPVVSNDQWLVARKELLKKEKEFTRLRDELTRQRRDLPWEKVEKEYKFDGPDGNESLVDLFGECSQLIVYHFMYGPDWQEGCNEDGLPYPMAWVRHKDRYEDDTFVDPYAK